MNIVCPNCNHSFETNTEPDVDILSQYGGEIKEPGVKKAIPTVSQYRERFKSHALRTEDVSPRKEAPKVVQLDGQLNNFTYKGEQLFFGSGTEVEY